MDFILLGDHLIIKVIVKVGMVPGFHKTLNTLLQKCFVMFNICFAIDFSFYRLI